MAEKSIFEPTPPISHPTSAAQKADSGDDPQPPATTSGEKPEQEDNPEPDTAVDGDTDTDAVRLPKRRKNCPTALENLNRSTTPNRTFSFTFDTKFAGFALEVTPKFGSFKAAATEVAEEDRCCSILEGKEEEDGGGGGDCEEREIDCAFGSVEVIKGID